MIVLGADGKLHVGQMKMSGPIAMCVYAVALREVKDSELDIYALERWCRNCFPEKT